MVLQAQSDWSRYMRYLLTGSVCTTDELEVIEERIEQEIEESARAALEAPFPDASIAQEDVYA